MIQDEMKIQADLVIKKHKGSIEVVGFKDLLELLKPFVVHKRNPNVQQIASNVLKLVFLGHTGFRFSIANFATTTAKASNLYMYVYSAIQKLTFC